MTVDFSEEFEHLTQFYRHNQKVQMKNCKRSHDMLVEAMQIYLDHHNEYLEMESCSKGLSDKMKQLYEEECDNE